MINILKKIAKVTGLRPATHRPKAYTYGRLLLHAFLTGFEIRLLGSKCTVVFLSERDIA